MTATLATMPRPATGSVETHVHKDGRTVSFYVRFRALGKRWRLNVGTNHAGWGEDRARVELDRILVQVERGTWEPPTSSGEHQNSPDETVHVTLSRWWGKHKGEVTANTRADYEWRIGHVLADQIVHTPTGTLDARLIDEFRGRLKSKALSPRSVNMVLGLLAQALDDAVDYRLLPANPARGPRRRMKVPKSTRSFLEPDMVLDLLDDAGAWERELPPHQHYGRRAFLATLCLAGPRISELTATQRGRVDLHAGAIVLGKKTAAGIDRHLDLTAFLRDELRGHLAAVPSRLRDRHGPALPLFPTRTGGTLNASNVRNRLLAETVKRTNARRAADGRMLLPSHVTPHTLRRTFASLCFFAGRDLRYVMGQLGHDDPRMTLAVYAQAMKRRDIDETIVWQLMRFPDEHDAAPVGGRKQVTA